MPVVAGRGARSAAQLQRAADELAAAAPDGELVLLDGADHGAHLTHPAELAAFARPAVDGASTSAPGIPTAGIRPDAVVGCPVGAINGAAVAADPPPAGVTRLERVWRDLRRGDVWPARPARAAVRLVRRAAATSGNGASRVVLDRGLPATFDDLAVPFASVAASLDTGQARWFTSGSLVDAVLASSALPGLVPPVELDGAAVGSCRSVAAARAATAERLAGRGLA